MKTTEVLIVGAGPTGLTLAVALANRGITAMIVDRQAAGSNTSRAAAVNARTLEVLEDLDLSRRMIKQGLITPIFTVRDHGRVLISIDFSDLPSKYPYTLTLPQSDTERILAERLTELGGAVLREKTVTTVVPDADGVTVSFADGDAVRATYVVGADGINSLVRTTAGIGFRGHEYEESFVLADVELTGATTDHEVTLFWERSGLMVVAPLPNGAYRVVAPVAEAPETPTAAFVQDLLDSRGPGPQRFVVTDVQWSSRFRIHHRVADTYRSGRLLLAGDAAHVHSPAGGQGMNLGIQDAVVLAERLAAVLAGGSDTLLDEYSAQRRPVATEVLGLTGRLTTLATMPAPLRPLRNTLIGIVGRFPQARRGLAMRLSGLLYR